MAKKKGKASAKSVNKAKDRIIDDKTFGLKNKKKSKKVQRFVQTVKRQVSDRMQRKYGKGGGGFLTYEQKQQRKRQEAEAKMMADIAKTVAKKKKEPEKKPLEDVPAEFIKVHYHEDANYGDEEEENEKTNQDGEAGGSGQKTESQTAEGGAGMVQDESLFMGDDDDDLPDSDED
eukprot:jgi/Bigna1/146400/aug1.114_g21108